MNFVRWNIQNLKYQRFKIKRLENLSLWQRLKSILCKKNCVLDSLFVLQYLCGVVCIVWTQPIFPNFLPPWIKMRFQSIYNYYRLQFRGELERGVHEGGGGAREYSVWCKCTFYKIAHFWLKIDIFTDFTVIIA